MCAHSASEEDYHAPNDIVPSIQLTSVTAAALCETRFSLDKCAAGAGQCNGTQLNSWKQLWLLQRALLSTCPKSLAWQLTMQLQRSRQVTPYR